MSLIPTEVIRLRNGAAAHLRPAEAHDAANLAALREAVARESSSPVVSPPPDESTPPAASLLASVRSFAAHPARLWLVAIDADGTLIAQVRCYGSSRPRQTHVATVSLSVAPARRGQGVGQALLEAIIRWAVSHPTIEKLTLFVLRNNAPAISLYENLGFQIEGTRRRALKLGPGRYADDLIMSRFVKPIDDASKPHARR